MEWHRNNPSARIQRLAPPPRRQQLFHVRRNMWLSLQQEHRLEQRLFIKTDCTCGCERLRITTAAVHLFAQLRRNLGHRQHAALPTNRLLTGEDLCRAPTRLTNDSKLALLNTATTDRACLR